MDILKPVHDRTELFAERRAQRHVFSPFNDASPFFADPPCLHAAHEDSHPSGLARYNKYMGLIRIMACSLFCYLPIRTNSFIPSYRWLSPPPLAPDQKRKGATSH